MTYAFLSLHQQHKRTKGLIDIHRVPEKKQATLIFAITSPSVEIFLQFLKQFVQE